MDNGRTMQRPGGRTARVREQVHDAIVELLDEVPWDEITVPMVAERSGVHAATVYRRWGTTTAILNDAVAERLTTQAPMPDTGSLREDLIGYGTQVATDMHAGLVPLILRANVLQIRPGQRREPTPAYLERTRMIERMLDRASDRGEATPTVAELLEILVAPLYFYALFTTPMPPSEVPTLVDRLLQHVASRTSPTV